MHLSRITNRESLIRESLNPESHHLPAARSEQPAAYDRYFATSGASSRLTSEGTASGLVMMAYFNADAHSHVR